MNIKIKVFDLEAQRVNNKNFLKNVILPHQEHSTHIVEIKTGKENLKNCDGLFTSNRNTFPLGIRSADCAAIAFYDDKRYGIIHAGWRGLVDGIVEKMMKNFTNPHIFVSPLLNEFEIKKDNCYQRIKKKFGKRFFVVEKVRGKEKIIFQFQKALASVLPDNAVFDLRDTFQNHNLASWRRDHDKGKSNFTIIYHNGGKLLAEE